MNTYCDVFSGTLCGAYTIISVTVNLSYYSYNELGVGEDDGVRTIHINAKL